MLETIRQYAEEQLVANGEADVARTAHARFFAGREPHVMAVWDGPRQRDAHDWFAVELPNLRAAFRWASDHGDLDTAASIAVYGTFLGFWVEQHEPVAWAEELIEPARIVEHRRLAQIYAMAAHCYVTGRFDDFVVYSNAYHAAVDSGQFDEVADAFYATLHGGFQLNDPVGCVERCLARKAQGLDNPYSRQTLVFALTIIGATDEAIAAAGNLHDADHTAENPHLRSAALLAYGFAHRDADPAAAYEVHQRGLAIAEESGNQQIASVHALSLARLAALNADPSEAFNYITQALRNYYDSGSFSMLGAPLIMLSGFLDRLGCHQPAAIISGFATSSGQAMAYPEIAATIDKLRKRLGDKEYDSLANAGRAMSNAAMAAFAFEQIDQARAQLPHTDELQ